MIAYFVLTKRCCCFNAPRHLAPFLWMKLMNMRYIYSSHFNKIKDTFSTQLDGREMMCPSSYGIWMVWFLDHLDHLFLLLLSWPLHI